MKKNLIETPRLLIRNLRSTDLDDFHSYRSDPEVTKYQGFDVMSREEAAAFIARQVDKTFGDPGEWVQYALEERATGKLIGDCAIRLLDDIRMAEIGMTLSPARQRQGYAHEAMRGILTHLFDTLQVHRVVETVDAENTASIALLRSLGFRQEGHFIENIFFKGKWGSEYQYAMLRREWTERD